MSVVVTTSASTLLSIHWAAYALTAEIPLATRMATIWAEQRWRVVRGIHSGLGWEGGWLRLLLRPWRLRLVVLRRSVMATLGLRSSVRSTSSVALHLTGKHGCSL